MFIYNNNNAKFTTKYLLTVTPSKCNSFPILSGCLVKSFMSVLYIYIFISNHINMIWPCSKDSEYVSDLEGIFPAYVVVHGQHGDVEAGQEDTSQDSFFFLI